MREAETERGQRGRMVSSQGVGGSKREGGTMVREWEEIIEDVDDSRETGGDVRAICMKWKEGSGGIWGTTGLSRVHP